MINQVCKVLPIIILLLGVNSQSTICCYKSDVKCEDFYNYSLNELSNLSIIDRDDLSPSVRVSADEKSVQNRLQEMISKKEYSKSWIGFHVVDIATGEVLFDNNGRLFMNPASLLKLITSATALELLGSDFRFQTVVGYTGEIKDGVLNGDLVIKGGGDPGLGSQYFVDFYSAPDFIESWAKHVKLIGIEQINGSLVLDGSLYDSEKIPPKWLWEDLGNYYGAVTSALSAYDNSFRLTFSSPNISGAPTKLISVVPASYGYQWANEVLASDDPRDLAYVFGSPIDKFRIIKGTIPKNRSSFTIRASNAFPEELLGFNFLTALQNQGVTVNDTLRFYKIDSDSFKEIYATRSPKLSRFVHLMNHKSINLIAEHLLRQIAVKESGVGSREEGIKALYRFWKDAGLDISSLSMQDGSGLSPLNSVSCEFITSLLTYMANRSGSFDVFWESLPKAGEGTLSQMNINSFPKETIHAKSGSMTGVRCLAGYLTADSGRRLAFTFMVNNFDGTHQKLSLEMEKVLLALKIGV